MVLLYAFHVVFAVFFGRNVFPAAFLETDVIIIAGNPVVAGNEYRSADMQLNGSIDHGNQFNRYIKKCMEIVI